MTFRVWSRSLGTSWWVRPLAGRGFAITPRTWPLWIAIRPALNRDDAARRWAGRADQQERLCKPGDQLGVVLNAANRSDGHCRAARRHRRQDLDAQDPGDQDDHEQHAPVHAGPDADHPAQRHRLSHRSRRPSPHNGQAALPPCCPVRLCPRARLGQHPGGAVARFQPHLAPIQAGRAIGHQQAKGLCPLKVKPGARAARRR